MKTEKLVLAVNNDKSIVKNFPQYFEATDFVSSAQSYIKAIKSGRMLCVIKSVSASGMSRVISFHSFEGTGYRQYWSLFKALGYSEDKNTQGFRIGGCGMDMVFATNYNIIHKLHSLGFITAKECATLAQKTPTTF